MKWWEKGKCWFCENDMMSHLFGSSVRRYQIDHYESRPESAVVLGHVGVKEPIWSWLGTFFVLGNPIEVGGEEGAMGGVSGMVS
jgi:hypothetical protein